MGRKYTSSDNERVVVSGDKSRTVSAPMKLSEYLTGYGDWLDYKMFAEIERHGGALVLKKRMSKNDTQETAHVLDFFRHYGGRGMLKFRCSGGYTDMKFLRAREEMQYQVYLKKLSSRLLYHVLTPDVVEVSSVSMNKVVLSRPFYKV